MMDKKTFEESRRRLERYVAQGRLRDAIAVAQSMASAERNYKISDELRGLDGSYRHMLGYVLTGQPDPERQRLTRQWGERLLTLADRMGRSAAAAAGEPSMYFDLLRYEGSQKGTTLGGLLQQWEAAAGNPGEQMNIERRLFGRIMVSYPLSQSSRQALEEALPKVSDALHQQIVGALLLGALQYYDEGRLALLADEYLRQPLGGQGAATLVALLTAMSYWSSRSGHSQVLREKLARIDPEDLAEAFVALARTRDSDRLHREIRRDVLPDMQRMGSQLADKLGKDAQGNLDVESLEENPEWEKMLEQNKHLADKMQEMNELFSDGVDVMGATFSSMKAFPFFHEAANWFVPFDPERTPMAGRTEAEALERLMNQSPMMCENDKYSLLLATSLMNDEMRSRMMQQLTSHLDQAEEMLRQDSGEDVEAEMARSRKIEINLQVRNLYRFFTLFRRKGEFNNPFAGRGVNLTENAAAMATGALASRLEMVAEFYFSHGYYEEALSTLTALEQSLGQAPQWLAEKRGWTLEKLGRRADALQSYEKATLITGESPSRWLLKRLGLMRQHAGDLPGALRAFRLLEEKQPDKATPALLVGHVLMAMDQFPLAVKQYIKAEYIENGSLRTLRPLAWALLREGDAERALKNYNRILQEYPGELTAQDWLNTGHASLALGKVAEAVDAYYKSIETGRDKGEEAEISRLTDEFVRDMKADRQVLLQAGIDPTLLPAVTDMVIYRFY